MKNITVTLGGQITADTRLYAGSGTEIFFIQQATGEVGIGTTNPGYKLDVAGEIRAGTEFYKGSIALGATGSSNTTSGASLIGAFDEFTNSDSTTVQDVLDDLDSVIGSLSSGTTGPWTDGGTYLYPSYAEYLGNPAGAGSNKLASIFMSDNSSVVYGSDNDFRTLFNGTNFIFGDTTNTFLGIGDSGTTGNFNFNNGQMYVRGDGNVGIGTTAPGVLLHTYKATENALQIETGDASNASLYLVNNSGTGKIGYLNSLLTFRNAPSGDAQMVLDTNGNVGIGTTSPSDKLDVAGGIRISSDSTWPGTNIATH